MRFRETFNKVVVVIGCLILMAALTALFLFPSAVLTAVGDWLLSWGQVFQNGAVWPDIAVGALLSLLVIFLLGLVIYWEVRSPRKRFIRVQQVAGGMAKVSTDSVREMLEHRLDSMPGIINVDSHVRARGNRVGVDIDADVARGTNVPETANRIIKVTQRVLTDDLGLQIDGAPEVSVTVIREEGETPVQHEEFSPERQPERQPVTHKPVRAPISAGADGGHLRQEEHREAVLVEEEEEFLVESETDQDLREQATAEDTRWLYEVENREATGRTETRGRQEDRVIYEREDTEEEEEPTTYHPSQQLKDPFDRGKETRI